GVRRAYQHRHLIRFEKVGELPDEGGLSRAVDAHHEDDGGTGFSAGQARIAVAGAERTLDAFLERIEKLVLRLDGAAARLAFYFGDQSHRDGHAEIGLEQYLLELLQ